MNKIVFKLLSDTPRYVQWTSPSLLFQTRRKNPLVYKGLTQKTKPILTTMLLFRDLYN